MTATHDTQTTPSDASLQQMLADMVAARVYSTRIFNLQRQGRAGTNAPVDGAEAAIVGQALTEDNIKAAGAAAAQECDPSADLRGSVAYKRDLVRIITVRAINKAIERAQGA